MPVTSVPLTLFFKASDGYGWSERYWYRPALGVPDIADATTLINYRAAMLTSNVTITHCRVGTTIKRLVVIFPINFGLGQVGTLPPPTASPDVAILFVFQAAGVGYNRMFIRGFDRESTSQETYNPSDAFREAALQWATYLKNSGLWYVVGTLGSPTVHIPAQGLAPTAPRGFLFESALFSGVVGDVVRFHGAQIPGYNGLKTIVDFQAGPPAIWTAGGAAPPVSDNSTHIYLTTIVDFDTPITSVFPDKVTKRGVGRPFGLVRGRARTLYALRQ